MRGLLVVIVQESGVFVYEPEWSYEYMVGHLAEAEEELAVGTVAGGVRTIGVPTTVGVCACGLLAVGTVAGVRTIGVPTIVGVCATGPPAVGSVGIIAGVCKLSVAHEIGASVTGLHSIGTMSGGACLNC